MRNDTEFCTTYTVYTIQWFLDTYSHIHDGSEYQCEMMLPSVEGVIMTNYSGHNSHFIFHQISDTLLTMQKNTLKMFLQHIALTCSYVEMLVSNKSCLLEVTAFLATKSDCLLTICLEGTGT